MNIAQITAYIKIFLIILIVIMIITVAVVFWYTKLRKPKQAELEEIDFSSLKRADTLDFIKFDDIKDDMVISHNNTVFMAAIMCQGFDYYTSTAAERKRAHDGMLSFINTFKNDEIVYRQYTKAVNMDNTLEYYKEAYDRIETDLFCASKDFDTLQAEYSSKKMSAETTGTEMDDVEELWYLEQLKQLNTLMDNLDWQRTHLQENINYINKVCDITSPNRVETYLFSWEYNSLSGRILTESQIHKKAKNELKRKAQTYIHALGNAGVIAVRMNTAQLSQMNRLHWHPYTANKYKYSDVIKSDFYAEIVNAPALIDADYEVAQENGFIDDLYKGQELLIANGKHPESLPLDKVVTYTGEDNEEDNDGRMSYETISELKDDVENRFKIREEQRKEAEEKKQREIKRRRMLDNIDYSGMEFGNLSDYENSDY